MSKTNDRIEKIRKFNRFYTQLLGLLDSSLLKSGYSLIESRILFELNEKPGVTATDLLNKLDIDPAYLSRILNKMKNKYLISKTRSRKDSRKQLLELTQAGQKVFSILKKMSNEHIKTLVSPLSDEDQNRLVGAMEIIQNRMSHKTEDSAFFTFRSHKPGDIGYITHRHGIFYSQEYGFDTTFDTYVAEGTAKFILNFNPEKERLWIAEEESVIVGSVAIVWVDDHTAQLRWLLVEPQARGKGLGRKLLGEAIDFCNRQGYQKIILWTLDNLKPARNLYKYAGFQLKENKSHRIWSKDLTEEKWELQLTLKK